MNISVTYSALRSNLKALCDKVCEDNEPILVERQNGENLVLISAEDYASMQETFYLLKSPKNAQRLMNATETLRSDMIEFETVDDLKNALGV